METKNSTDGPIPPENQHDAAAKIAKSVNGLNDVSISIQAFKNRYDELQKHLDFIAQAIDTRTKELETLGTATVNGITDNGDIVRSKPESELESKAESEGREQEEELEEEEEYEEEEEEEEEKDELLSICKKMNSKGLRRYIVKRLSNTKLLKEKIPVALKTAPVPLKLVFECIGKFYLQGSRAYTTNPSTVNSRLVSVLIMEYYLLSGCVETEAPMEASLKKETAGAAISWRLKLKSEGGVATASEMDARGLILFLACFGIPGFYRNEEIVNLVRLSKPGEISHALRRCKVLRRRVSDIAEGMMKKGKFVEAMELAYAFGFEEKFSPKTSLNSFLQKSNAAYKKAKQEAQDVPRLLKKANENYLTAVKSLVNCLENNKVDIVKVLPGWKLKDTILRLEKENVDVAENIEDDSVSKRKLDNSSTSNEVKGPDTKRTRYPVRDPFVVPPSVTALQGQRIASHMDGNSSYDSSLTAKFLEGRSYGYPNNYSTAASAQIGSVSGSLPEGFLGRGVTSGGSMIGGAMTGSLSGYQSDMSIDNVGTTLNNNSSLYSRLHSIDEGVLSYNRSIEQNFVGQPSSARVSHLYGRTSAEGYIGLPDHHSIGVPSRSAGGGSDLYSFADSVFDM